MGLAGRPQGRAPARLPSATSAARRANPERSDSPEPESEVLVDHDDLVAREPELDRALHERVLPGGRLDVALKLRLRGLADIDERGPRRGEELSFERSLTDPSLLVLFAGDRLRDQRR